MEVTPRIIKVTIRYNLFSQIMIYIMYNQVNTIISRPDCSKGIKGHIALMIEYYNKR